MSAIKGVREREHRAFFQCPRCDEDIHARCSRCGFWFCQSHLHDHDCVKLLRQQLDKYLDWLNEAHAEHELLKKRAYAEQAMLQWEERIPPYEGPQRWAWRSWTEDQRDAHAAELSLKRGWRM